MMRETGMDYSVLGWVSGELDDTLRQAAEALERFAEEGGEGSEVTDCAGFLHQAAGTLRMLELEGLARLAGEMEELARALAAGEPADADAANERLMGGILRLRNHLEALAAGTPVSPLPLVALINELRSARGAESLPQGAFFAPISPRWRSVPTIPDGTAPTVALRWWPVRGCCSSVGCWSCSVGRMSAAALARMSEAVERMDRAAPDVYEAAPWWVGAALLEAVSAGQLDSGARRTRALLSRLEREMKRVADGTAGDGPDQQLLRDLLRALAGVDSGGGPARDRRSRNLSARYPGRRGGGFGR
ncbi:MAG: Hpt domain-containing protein [Arhodomonas sp.]|nr:Hpt domain-containing protein [Arhodomonas sp.]